MFRSHLFRNFSIENICTLCILHHFEINRNKRWINKRFCKLEERKNLMTLIKPITRTSLTFQSIFIILHKFLINNFFVLYVPSWENVWCTFCNGDCMCRKQLNDLPYSLNITWPIISPTWLVLLLGCWLENGGQTNEWQWLQVPKPKNGFHSCCV